VSDVEGSTLMNKDELLVELRRLELKLHSVEVQQHFMAEQDAEVRKRFVEERIELSRMVGVLTHEKLASIQQQLTQLDPQLRAGIKDIDAALESVQDAVAFLDALGKILGLVGRVLAIV
jgi:hypothetical protein